MPPPLHHQRRSARPPPRHERGHLTPQQVLAKLVPGRADPLKVLEVLIKLFNAEHTAIDKTVSFKTREQRALFLRRFFRDLRSVGGFKTLPDPRNIGERHIQVMVLHWQERGLSIGTVQTYMSYLRGLCNWVGKPGMVRHPHDYGFSKEARRVEVAQHDKSWSGQGVDVDKKIEAVEKEDLRVGTMLRLMFAFALRAKEAVMFRPHVNVCTLEDGRHCIHIRQGSKGGRPRKVLITTPAQETVLSAARQLAAAEDDPIGDPARSLKSSYRRFYYVVGKMGITMKEMNTTSHGLRHEGLNDVYEVITGHRSPVRGGHCPDPELDREARSVVARMAGHSRVKASSAYLGAIMGKRKRPAPLPPPSSGDEHDPDPPEKE